MPRPAKNPEEKFLELPQDWRTKVEALSIDDLKNELMVVVDNERENLKNKDEDQHLKEAKESYTDAAAQYKEASKAHKLMINYVLRILGDKGAV
jgi:hypothetical protein